MNGAGFKKATQFYVDLVRNHGQAGAPQAGYTECLNNLVHGNAAMWYDATSTAGSLEAANSPVQGKIGYAPAPVVGTASSGWLYAWSWSLQQASAKEGNAWKFISWASSKEYEELMAAELGWSKVPAGKRASTYHNAAYLQQHRRSPTRPVAPSKAPTPVTLGFSRGQRWASNSSTYPSFPTSVRRCPTASAPRSPARSPLTQRWNAGSGSPTTWPSATAPGSRGDHLGGIPLDPSEADE